MRSLHQDAMIYSCFHCDRMDLPKCVLRLRIAFRSMLWCLHSCSQRRQKSKIPQNSMLVAGELPLFAGRREAGRELDHDEATQFFLKVPRTLFHLQVVLVPPGQHDVLNSTRYATQKRLDCSSGLQMESFRMQPTVKNCTSNPAQHLQQPRPQHASLTSLRYCPTKR